MDAATLYRAAFGIATIVVLLVVHRLLRKLMAPKAARGTDSVRAELLGGNHAHAMREVGDILAIFLVGAAVVRNSVHDQHLLTDVIWCAVFSVLGIVLLELTGLLGLRLLIHKRIGPALDRGNMAAGVAASAHYVAVGLLTSRAVGGSDVRGFGLSLIFFLLGVVAHQVLILMFRALTTYDDAEQIEGENLAAAISYSGMSIAVAIIVARAIEGEFVDWPTALSGFGALTLTTVALYPVRQIIVQGLLLGGKPTFRGGDLDIAIGRDRNVGTAALEAASYLGAALAVAVLA
jgi:uncharacterized membrane protein YjfL (UPF0719 family)